MLDTTGGILVGIAFWLLWTVPRDWSREGMFAYFVVASLFFYTVVPVYAIPHGALGLEMTEDYHEKTSLFAYASFIGNVGAFTLPWVYFLANRPFFGGAAETTQDRTARLIARWEDVNTSTLLGAVARPGRHRDARRQTRAPGHQGADGAAHTKASSRAGSAGPAEWACPGVVGYFSEVARGPLRRKRVHIHRRFLGRHAEGHPR